MEASILKNLNRAEGIYYIKHDLMQGVNERVTTFPFETRFDDEITRRSKDKNEFSQLVVSDIALKQDGGALLITEIKKNMNGAHLMAQVLAVSAATPMD